ncbi:related to gibberellin 20-oxidase [Phialocephala subalpina]|uniref:Related to gibberellin 20-oxidase n=1 Tax=Phialocephala subalpina TaxID=576137 RepID=A0A1L7WVQ6_9HELO|nr:related to gibberellin 20-oxidase [Phialocephala subalpina]
MGSTTESPTQLPIIDLTPFLSPTSTPQSRLQCAKSLVHACHTTGFIYITNHGIPPALLSEAFSWSKRFFALSEDEKSQASHPPGSNVFRGYSKVGHEMIPEMEGEKVRGVVDFNESYGMGHDGNKGQPNVWLPDSILPGYRVFVDKFYSKCWKTSTSVLRALALGLELESEDYLLQFHSEIENELTFRHYPPVDAGRVKSGEMDRLGAHTDFDSFTLLWQDENAGLEVKVRDLEGKGEWRSVDFVEGALVMNIGDVLSRWSNGTSFLLTPPPKALSFVPFRPVVASKFKHEERLSHINTPPCPPPNLRPQLRHQRRYPNDETSVLHSVFRGPEE